MYYSIYNEPQFKIISTLFILSTIDYNYSQYSIQGLYGFGVMYEFGVR